MTSNRDLQNNFRLRLRNRSNQEETYTIQILKPAEDSVRWSDTAPTLKPNESKLVPIMITAPLGITAANHGSVNATVTVTDQSGHWREIPIRILGPG
ncbi:MAG: FixG Ig-like domain-containing protein [Pirellula sp.]